MFIPAAFLYRAWISQFGQLPETRSRVYCCIDNILQLEDSAPYEANLALLYGDETLTKAHALINRTEQFFWLASLRAEYGRQRDAYGAVGGIREGASL